MKQLVYGDDAELRAVRAFLLGEDEAPAFGHGDPALPLVVTVSDIKPSPKVSTNKPSKVSTHKQSKVSNTKARARQVHASHVRVVNASRERLQHEIATLRQQEIALQQRLAALERGEIDQEGESEKVMRMAWQTVAHEQLAQRAAVEKERDELRALIKSNKLWVRRVRRFLVKWNVPDGIPFPLRSCSRWFTGANTEAVFSEIARCLDTMYTHIDDALKDSALDRLVDDFQDLRIENDMTPMVSVECRDSRLLPSDVETTAEVMWLHRQTRATAFAQSNLEVLEKTDNSIRRRFDMPLRGDESGNRRIYVWSEVRRFVRGNDHLVLSCALATLTNEIAGGFNGLRYVLSSWTRVRSPQNPALTTMKNRVSLIEVFETAKPILPISVDPREAREFCADVMTELQRLERQAIENLLLDMAHRYPPRMILPRQE